MVYCYICTSHLKDHEIKHLLIRKQDIKKNKICCHECKSWIKLFDWDSLFPNKRIPTNEEMGISYKRNIVMERIYLKRKEEEKKRNKRIFLRGNPDDKRRRK